MTPQFDEALALALKLKVVERLRLIAYLAASIEREITGGSTEQAADKMGYPPGYFEETYGSFADDPLERPPQPPLDKRENLED